MRSCPEFEALSAHLDGEGDASTAAHVAGCPACEATVSRMRGLGEGLRAHARAEDTSQLAASLSSLKPPRSRRRLVPAFVAAAAAAAVAVLSLPGGTVPEAVADEAVSQHLRAFANGRACETESPDPDRLEQFFAQAMGREIDVPPPARGRLVGARGCSLFGERAAAIVYAEGDVQVTMFVPPPGSRAAKSSADAVGRCASARDGQTVCVVAGDDGSPRVVVGGLSADELGTLIAQR